MNLVYYSQEDKRWAYRLYSNRKDPTQTIATSGCGPTCFAMTASSFGVALIPPTASVWAVEHGYRTPNDGTAWGYFSAISKAHGLTCKQTSSLYEVEAALKAGALVIASMGSGHLTKGGHYVLLVGIDGKWIDVYDPNPDNRSYGHDAYIDQGVKDDGRIRVQEYVFQREAKQYWIISKGDAPMTKEEKAAFDKLAAQVGQLSSAVTTLTLQLKSATERVPAPPWFVTEFGSANLGGKIQDPHFTEEGWRALAVSARSK